MPAELTPAEQLDYLVSSARLSLWFAWQFLDKHPEETFLGAIQNRTDLWRRTIFNSAHLDGGWGKFEAPEWAALMKRVEGIHARNRKGGSAQAFEDEAIAVIMPYLEPRVERDLRDIRNKVDLAHYQCGSLRYNLKPDAERPGRIGFHIANACSPASPFDDPSYFPRCFMDLMEQCEKEFKVTEIGTGTWLNSYPRWLKLFPRDWLDHMGPPNYDVQWHYGFWGQFITSRRTFNHRLGRQFRETGRIPYPPRSSWCAIKAMRKHLQPLLKPA
ncbi:MAG: hypothetical protein GX608_02500 [Lentisphaerae bacterium]|nr:hypothetical protein [Lentisphaerota bacterium]